MENLYKKTINNIDINLRQTKKYTNLILSIDFLQNFNEKSDLYLSMCSRIISKCNNKYPSMKLFSERMYELYGLGISCKVFKNYKTYGLRFMIDIVNQNLVENNTLYEEAFDLLYEVINNPFTDKSGNEFDNATLKEIKEFLINSIISLYNNKIKYAGNRFLNKMTKKDEFPLNANISISEIKKVKSKDLYNYYVDFIKNSKVIVCGIGDIEFDYFLNLVNKLDLKSRNIELEFEDKNLIQIKKPKRITEYAKLQQAIINMGYRTDIMYRDKLYPAHILFSIMFGEIAASTLFTKIREEKGLAYNVYSTIIPERNLFLVYAAVDNEKVSLTINEIKKELEFYQSGKIIEDEYYQNLLDIAKEELKNEKLQSCDNQIAAIFNDFRSSIVSRRTLSELYDDAKDMTLEDIKNASNHLVLDTIHVLKGEKNGK